MRFQLATLYTIVFFSGFAGLGYEMAWTRMLSVGLGHEAVSVLAVVAAFFCGMAIGSWVLGRIVSSGRSKITMNRWYAGAETVIGFWSLILIFLIPWANRVVTQWMGIEPSPLQHWSISFLFPFALLLPATFAMGGTLPLVSRIFQQLRATSSPIGGLYATNTFGAVAGTLLSTFLIVPNLGYQTTLLSFAVLNFFCAAGAFFYGGCSKKQREFAPEPSKSGRPVRGMAALLFITGFLGIGYEVLIVRAMSQILESTVYSFANILALYLLGTACGAAIYQRVPRRKPFGETLAFLLTSLAGLCLLGTFLMGQSVGIHEILRNLWGRGFAESMLTETTLAAVVFLPPTLAMGAMFTHLAQKADAEGNGFGIALCINTFGASLAPFVFGVLLLPLLGPKVTLISVSAGYLALIPLSTHWLYKPLFLPLFAGAILLISPYSLDLVTLEPGDVILEHHDGIMASVTVVKDHRNEIHLKINNRFQMGGTSSVFSDRREGHIPLLLHPGPRKALFLGMGTGGTLAAAADYPGLEAKGVELVPEVISLLHHFERATGNLNRLPRLDAAVADARRYVNCSREKYDVVVADLFHPARDGSGALYTREHFQAIKARLDHGGVFCQWLPLFQLDLDTLRVIVRSFLDVFPNGSALLAHYSLKAPIIALVSGMQAGGYPSDWWKERTGDPILRNALEKLRLDSVYSLLGCFLASSDELREFAGEAPLNTDNRPVVTFEAPRFAYGEQEPAATRLLTLIDRFKPKADEILAPARTEEDRDAHRRLASYWKARNRFIHAGVGVPEASDVRLVLQETRESLLEVIWESPDFTAAYLPLLAMAQRLYPIDPAGSKALLLDLEKANPHSDEARSARQRLFPE